jgi:hypothetical protein
MTAFSTHPPSPGNLTTPYISDLTPSCSPSASRLYPSNPPSSTAPFFFFFSLCCPPFLPPTSSPSPNPKSNHPVPVRRAIHLTARKDATAQVHRNTAAPAAKKRDGTKTKSAAPVQKSVNSTAAPRARRKVERTKVVKRMIGGKVRAVRRARKVYFVRPGMVS